MATRHLTTPLPLPFLKTLAPLTRRRSRSHHLVPPSSSISSMAPALSKKVLIPIANGTEPMEAVITIDVLRRSGADVTVASVEKDLRVDAAWGLKLVADSLVADCAASSFDLISLPGGMPGSANLRDCTVLETMVKQHVEKGSLYAAICAAPAVALGSWGLLKGSRATCYPSWMDKMPSEAIKVESRVQLDGRVVTSRGPGTSMEFSLALVEQLFGKDKADEVAEPMVMRPCHGVEFSMKELNSMEWKHNSTPQDYRCFGEAALGKSGRQEIDTIHDWKSMRTSIKKKVAMGKEDDYFRKMTPFAGGYPHSSSGTNPMAVPASSKPVDNNAEILVPVANGSEEMEAVMLIDILRRAKANVIVASVEDKLEIVASRKVKLVADMLLDDALEMQFDLIVLPGGIPGAEAFSRSEKLVGLLKKQAGSNKLYGAMCASPAIVLQPHGLLQGKKATAYPALCSKLSDQSECENRVVVDGNLITSRSPGTTMEFALGMVEKLFGRESALDLAKAMVFT